MTNNSHNKTERIQLSLYAQNLKNVAGLFKGTSDPYAVVTQIASTPTEKPHILGKTEVIKNSLSPHWVTTFDLEYDFCKELKINVGVYDEVRKGENKPMGTVIFEIGDILGARGNIKAKRLKNGGTLFCRARKAPPKEETAAAKFQFQLKGMKLKNVDGLFGKSDPFFEISKCINAAGGNTWQVVYRSEVIKNNLNPQWKSVSVSLDDLCHSNRDEKIRITVKDWEKSGKHTPMGHFETTVNEIMKNKGSATGYILKRGVKQYGQILVVAASALTKIPAPSQPSAVPAVAPSTATATTAAAAATLVPLPPPEQPQTPTKLGISTAGLVPMVPPAPIPTFIDYLSGGLELQLSVAIDFTGSNGDPRQPGTLHYIDRYHRQLNDYEKALTAVGGIVAKYDHDQQFPVMGFGAKYHGQIQHCFQLGSSAEVHGVKGMLDAYRSTFASGLTMSGPTVFSQVIDVAAAQARDKQQRLQRFGQQSYHILLILTDGAVSDVMSTKQSIAAAGTAPLSIVIVGIGNADFRTMQFLDDFADSDNQIRDVCQFVEFRRHAHNKLSLTEATLEEIPDQVVDYFQSNNIQPLPPVSGSQLSLVPEDDYIDEEEIPLDLNFNEDGEITLGSGGVYDATDYNNTTYVGMTPMVPPSAPAAQPTVPYDPQHQQQPYSMPAQPPQQPIYAAPSSQATPYYPPAQQQPQSYSPPPPAVQAAKPAVFHVQVPPGVYPGQQLQIQHPKNGQAMIVVVPNGAQAGGTFAVAY